MLKELDRLDKAILNRLDENPWFSIRDVIRPFLLERSESVLRERVRALELRNLIRLDKTKREVLCFRISEVVK